MISSVHTVREYKKNAQTFCKCEYYAIVCLSNRLLDAL